MTDANENQGDSIITQAQASAYLRDKIRHPKKRAFLVAYMQYGTVFGASQRTGIARQTFYNWVRDDPAFAEASESAREVIVEIAEQEVRRRALLGVAEPVFYKGEVCGHVKKYSDLLLMFYLKSIAPERFRENSVDITSGNMPIKLYATVSPDDLPDMDSGGDPGPGPVNDAETPTEQSDDVQPEPERAERAEPPKPKTKPGEFEIL